MKIKLVLLKLFKQELVKGSFWLFLGGTFGNFTAFIFNLFLARRLSYEDYGIYTSLLSLYSLLTIPAGILAAVIIRFATHYFAKDEKDRAAALYKKMTLVWFLLGTVIALVIFVLHPLLLSFLNIKNPIVILILAITVGLTYFGIVNNAFIQSLTKFLYLSFVTLAGAFFRLSVGVLLVFSGLSVTGALLGSLSTPVVAILLGFIPLIFLFKTKSHEAGMETKEIVYYAVPVSVGLIALSSFITSDVILVKHFFSPVSAGLYGGLSIVGKVIFYFTAFIPSVMFPLIVKKHTKGEDYKSIYLLAIILIGFPSLLITIFYFLFPGFNLSFFLGGRQYLTLIPFLGLYGIFITLFNLTSLTVNFFLSIKKTTVSYFVLIFAVLQVFLIYLFHQNFYEVIFSSILSVSLLLALLLIYFYRTQKT